MLFSVRHRTSYFYSEPVSLSYHLGHLRPLDLPHQECRMHRISVHPLPASIHEDHDYFGNGSVTFTIAQPHRELVVDATSEVEMNPRELPESWGASNWSDVAAEARAAASPAALFASEFLFPTPITAASGTVAEFAQQSFAEGRPLRDAILDLSRHIYENFIFDSQATDLSTAPHELLRLKRGVCQDFAHLTIACCRALGIPARYVSGYLETEPPAGQPRLVGVDASHAWASVYAGDGHWVEIDPTNDRLAGIGHLVAAYGRDYADVSPLKGVILGGGRHSMEVAVDVDRRLL